MILTGIIEFLFLFYRFNELIKSEYIIIVINILLLIIIGFIVLFLFIF